MHKIMLVDDHPIFRMGMSELLDQEEDFTVCAVAEDMASARTALNEHEPDIAIIDITLAKENGLQLVQEITSSRRPIPTLVLSMHDESVWAERAIKAGARGYIMKKEASESVITALRSIVAGQIHVSPNMMSILLDKLQVNSGKQKPQTEESLTERELEVYRLIGTGFSTREIAEKMALGIKTIGTYRARIKEKLGIRSGSELVRRAVIWNEASGSVGTKANRPEWHEKL